MRIFAVLNLFVLVLGILLVACAEQELACRSGSTSYYQDALSKQLDKMGVRYERSAERGLCVPKARQADLEKAATSVDSFHYQVAIKPRDACEEKALVAWLTQQGFPFVVSPAMDSEGRPAGNLVQVPALVPEDVSRYLQKLESAPKDSRCSTQP
jgi:hypothetical protein